MLPQPLFVPGGFGPLEMGIILLLLLIILAPIGIVLLILQPFEGEESDEEYPIAPTSLRVVAALIDLVVISFLGFIALGILSVTPISSSDIFSIQVFILAVFLAYFAYMEAEYGYTVGKYITNLRVLDEEREEIGWNAAIVRNLVRFVDYLPNLYLIGFIVILITDKNQRIGDGTADTIVVRTE